MEDGRAALLVVDVQRDFFPGGTIPVDEAEDIVPTINKLIDAFGIVITTQDWHPENSEHFERFPVHCVRKTDGAKLHPELKLNNRTLTFIKGMLEDEDALSAFEAKSAEHGIGLTEMLEELNVRVVFICGLATDYCVYATAKGAAARQFNTAVIVDAVRAVGDNDEAIKVISDIDGVRLLNAEEVLQMLGTELAGMV